MVNEFTEVESIMVTSDKFNIANGDSQAVRFLDEVYNDEFTVKENSHNLFE